MCSGTTILKYMIIDKLSIFGIWMKMTQQYFRIVYEATRNIIIRDSGTTYFAIILMPSKKYSPILPALTASNVNQPQLLLSLV